MVEEFKKLIIQWEKINRRVEELGRQIQPITDRIKEEKKSADELEVKIVDYMSQNNLENSKIEIGDIQIHMRDYKRMETMNREYLENKCSEFLRDEKTAKKLVEYLFQGRQPTMSTHLSRKKSKKGLKVSK
jgi:predicted RNase H-like nuclease (RuvC/YqgF family)